MAKTIEIKMGEDGLMEVKWGAMYIGQTTERTRDLIRKGILPTHTKPGSGKGVLLSAADLDVYLTRKVTRSSGPGFKDLPGHAKQVRTVTKRVREAPDLGGRDQCVAYLQLLEAHITEEAKTNPVA